MFAKLIKTLCVVPATASPTCAVQNVSRIRDASHLLCRRPDSQPVLLRSTFPTHSWLHSGWVPHTRAAKSRALPRQNDRSLESKVFLFPFIFLILGNNNKLAICVCMNNVHMQTSKLDISCISVSILLAHSMVLSVLASIEMQKMESWPSAECEKRCHWVTITLVLFSSRMFVSFIVFCTWGEKAD